MNPADLIALAERVEGLASHYHAGGAMLREVAAAFGRHQEMVPWGRHRERWCEWDDSTRRWVAPLRPLASLDDLVRIAKPWLPEIIPPCPIKATAAALRAIAAQVPA